MTDFTLPLFPLPKPKLKHLFIKKEPKRFDYRGSGYCKLKLREVERRQHSQILQRQLHEVEQEFALIEKSIANQELPKIKGLTLKILTEPGYPLGPDQIYSLTTRTDSRSASQITLLTAMQIKDHSGLPLTRIVLHVPFGGLSHLEKKVKEFSKKSGERYAYLSNVSFIARAALDELWTDPSPLPKDTGLHWWELWVRRYPEETWGHFSEAIDRLQIETRGDPLLLPEHRVIVAHATYATLSESIPLLDTLV